MSERLTAASVPVPVPVEIVNMPEGVFDHVGATGATGGQGIQGETGGQGIQGKQGIPGVSGGGHFRQSQAQDPSLPATTTFQQDLTFAGQRQINLIWEYTQAIVALMVILANMTVAVYQGLQTGMTHAEFPVILSSALFLVIGFYFSRTNHAAIGGIGAKPSGVYVGR